MVDSALRLLEPVGVSINDLVKQFRKSRPEKVAIYGNFVWFCVNLMVKKKTHVIHCRIREGAFNCYGKRAKGAGGSHANYICFEIVMMHCRLISELHRFQAKNEKNVIKKPIKKRN